MLRRQKRGLVVKKVTIEGRFPCAVCRNGVESNSTLCQFCRCWVHKRCSGIRGKLKEDSKGRVKGRSSYSQMIVSSQRLSRIAEDCPGT